MITVSTMTQNDALVEFLEEFRGGEITMSMDTENPTDILAIAGTMTARIGLDGLEDPD